MSEAVVTIQADIATIRANIATIRADLAKFQANIIKRIIGIVLAATVVLAILIIGVLP